MQDRQFRDVSRSDRQALEMLGAAVRIGRGRMGLSQDALAGNAELSPSAVSRLERGMVWGMAVARFARVAWALRERMPLGGCPHPHTCSYNTEWQYARQRILEGPVVDLDPDDGPEPPTSMWTLPVDAHQPPSWWPGWGAVASGTRWKSEDGVGSEAE